MAIIQGYSIDVADLKCNMLENLQLPDCAKYSNIYDLNIVDSNFSMEKKYDISCTYDGFDIVSEAFVQFCRNENYTGVEFVGLSASPSFLASRSLPNHKTSKLQSRRAMSALVASSDQQPTSFVYVGVSFSPVGVPVRLLNCSKAKL